jgi:hypothetical protein
MSTYSNKLIQLVESILKVKVDNPTVFNPDWEDYNQNKYANQSVLYAYDQMQKHRENISRFEFGLNNARIAHESGNEPDFDIISEDLSARINLEQAQLDYWTFKYKEENVVYAHYNGKDFGNTQKKNYQDSFNKSTTRKPNTAKYMAS